MADSNSGGMIPMAVNGRGAMGDRIVIFLRNRGLTAMK
jgi:hypothetical protein